SRHADEERMEVGAIAMLGGAGVDRVAMAPTCAVVVIVHGGDHVVVNLAGLRDRLGGTLRLLLGKLADLAVNGDKMIGLKVMRKLGLRRGRRASGRIERHVVLIADEVEGEANVE